MNDPYGPIVLLFETARREHRHRDNYWYDEWLDSQEGGIANETALKELNYLNKWFMFAIH